MVFGYDGNPNIQTENQAPFALAGDNNGNYAAWTPTLGAHTLSATPYEQSGGSGNAGTALSINFTVSNTPSGNQPPIVDAGSDRFLILPDNATTLNGSASDPNNDISSIEWTQVSGSPATLNNTNSLNLSVSNLSEGAYRFRLTVSDSSGLSTWDGSLCSGFSGR